MPKMTIEEAAAHFAISKEAIHNRIRRGTLISAVEGGVKFVTIENTQTSADKVASKRVNTRQASPQIDDRYTKLLEEQNAALQGKIEKFELEIRTLREQKEEMLIQERIKIEQIYKEKDEHLKSMLHAFSAQFMLSAPLQENKEEHVEAEIEISQRDEETISLEAYLKEHDFSKKKSKKVKETFQKRAGQDERIIVHGETYYMNTLKYDYSDLLK
jgi:hypothetical protein